MVVRERPTSADAANRGTPGSDDDGQGDDSSNSSSGDSSNSSSGDDSSNSSSGDDSSNSSSDESNASSVGDAHVRAEEFGDASSSQDDGEFGGGG